jgi:hypothetical protein
MTTLLEHSEAKPSECRLFQKPIECPKYFFDLQPNLVKKQNSWLLLCLPSPTARLCDCIGRGVWKIEIFVSLLNSAVSYMGQKSPKFDFQSHLSTSIICWINLNQKKFDYCETFEHKFKICILLTTDYKHPMCQRKLKCLGWQICFGRN